MCHGALITKSLIPHLPVFTSSVTQDFQEDLFADQIWGECISCGLIQLMKLVPLDVLYSQNHNAEVVGATWSSHHEEFAKFILGHEPRKMLEIGASHGYLSQLLTAKKEDLIYTIIDPNLGGVESPRITRITGFIEEHLEILYGCDIVMSHVLEHLYNPGDFLNNVAENLRVGDRLFLSTPQIYEWLKLRSPNALNFEHSYYLNIAQIKIHLENLGFELIRHTKYLGHSEFTVFQKVSDNHPSRIGKVFLESDVRKREFLHFINETKDFCIGLNNFFEKEKSGVYLYGASLFSQILLGMGFKETYAISVLDNASYKWGERLYGTRLNVEPVSVLKSSAPINLVLRMGPYQSEIRNQILSINPNVRIFE